MAKAVSALQGLVYEGYVTIREVGPCGMITLRGAASDLAPVVQDSMGLALPGPRRIETAGERSVAWMSPDEFLLILPYAQVQAMLEKLNSALKGRHFLAVDVSDARAVFTITGPKAREVLAKLSPVDLSHATFQPGEIRRSRAAQVAAAFWISGADEFTLVSFRSVAAYVFALLQSSATPGSEVGLH